MSLCKGAQPWHYIYLCRQTICVLVCTRYRSQLCNDGPKCRRKVCFFAHTIDELRVPPSKPFVAADTLVGSPEADATSSQVRNLPL